MIRENFEEAERIDADLNVISITLDHLKIRRPVDFSTINIRSNVFREDLIDFLTEEQKKLNSIFSRL